MIAVVADTTVVADTGPLLHLNEANALNLLEMVGRVHVPPQVTVELANLWTTRQLPSWINIVRLNGTAQQAALLWQQAGLLDGGEAEAIALAQQIKADWLLTDDTAARLFANELGLEAHGSLGIVLWAAAAGHIDYAKARESLSRLAASSLWLSQRILQEAQAALDSMF